MCTLTDKIKFCTCADSIDVEQLNNYWILYRHHDTGGAVIGESMTPEYMFQESYGANTETVLNRLNSGSAFDKDLAIGKRDRFYLVLNNLNDSKTEYLYEFDGRQWVVESAFEPDSLFQYEKEEMGELEDEGLEN